MQGYYCCFLLPNLMTRVTLEFVCSIRKLGETVKPDGPARVRELFFSFSPLGLHWFNGFLEIAANSLFVGNILQKIILAMSHKVLYYTI